MNREIEQAILTEGYRFCRVQPENIGVFYKYYQQGFHVVMMISLEDTQALTVEQHQVMQERLSSAGKTCRFSGRLSGLSCGIAYTAVW